MTELSEALTKLPAMRARVRAETATAQQERDHIRLLLNALEEARDVLSHAHEWLDELGCDCGTDEPGTCAYCRVAEALGQ